MRLCKFTFDPWFVSLTLRYVFRCKKCSFVFLSGGGIIGESLRKNEDIRRHRGLSQHESDSGGGIPKIEQDDTILNLKKKEEKQVDFSAFEDVFADLEEKNLLKDPDD